VGRNTSSRWPSDTTMKRWRSFSCSLQASTSKAARSAQHGDVLPSN
jgi:hypothetical protein